MIKLFSFSSLKSLSHRIKTRWGYLFKCLPWCLVTNCHHCLTTKLLTHFLKGNKNGKKTISNIKKSWLEFPTVISLLNSTCECHSAPATWWELFEIKRRLRLMSSRRYTNNIRSNYNLDSLIWYPAAPSSFSASFCFLHLLFKHWECS